ncbi:1,4-dihydroxy-6-naphthoate synthase [Desulfonatronum thioautotrophicum]|uniref:1,4-dihydroxy-6-naphthoate synthase n=1 Tax=Desulfonatronum thioautotrophicum TaxID=617001 RepID=UPI0005EB6F2C|nr:1,4-dihydroxy-6-naphthoate synthase [Desulfonatronum thioautotrophicum]
MSDPVSPPLPLTVAISPCPNDTFIFGAWVLGQCSSSLKQPASFIWEDVQVLNEAAARGGYDVIKVSAAQALDVLDNYVLLPSGGAFSTNQGPKLVAAASKDLASSTFIPQTIAVPGMQTTAATLLRRAWPHPAQLVPMRYDRIVDAVLQGKVDAGLLIHESALLLDRYALACLLDLGRWWEGHSGGMPLPLGCILGRRTLGSKILEQITNTIQDSLDRALQTPDLIWPLIQALAQEMDDDVLWTHIQTYVNHFSRNMDEEGVQALDALRLAAGKPRKDFSAAFASSSAP